MTTSRAEPFPEVCRAALVEETPAILETLRREVLWREDLNSGGCMSLQAIYPLAYLYATRFAGNAHHRSREVLQTVAETGDFLAACVGPRRTGRPAGTARSLLAGLDWAILFWLDAYGLVGGALGAARRRRWRAGLASVLTHYEHRVRGYLDQERFNSCSFNTSPNHAVSYAADLLVAGIVLKRRPWVDLAEAFAERFARSQRPAGYWPEGHGPVGGYQSVSLAGIARFHALRPKAVYHQALARALEYHEAISYPDHTFLALIDKRQRYRDAPSILGLHGFSFVPRGRALAKAVLLASLRRGRPHNGSFWARLLENYVHFRRGPMPRHRPWRAERMLEDHSLFVRENGWQFNLSVNPVVVNPRSPFRLDYQSLFSVWHESVGLIVPGSQDKNRPWHGTFFARGGRGLGVLHGGRIGSLARPRYLEAFYANNVTGRIEAALSRPDTLDLAVSLVRSPDRGDVRFNLPLRAGLGETLTVAGRAHVLTCRKIALPVRAGAEVAVFGRKVALRCRAAGRLHFPCLPWNPYSRSHRSTLHQAFLRLEIPLGRTGAATRIRIRIRPKAGA